MGEKEPQATSINGVFEGSRCWSVSLARGKVSDVKISKSALLDKVGLEARIMSTPRTDIESLAGEEEVAGGKKAGPFSIFQAELELIFRVAFSAQKEKANNAVGNSDRRITTHSLVESAEQVAPRCR
jgi:hypothetical protein